MSELPLGRADYHRSVPKEARIETRNRYFEANPVLTDTGATLIARPALKRFVYVGTGPIRAIYSQSGDFEEALFVVSGTGWYRVDVDGTVTLLYSGIAASGQPIMAATGPIGSTPEYLFLADGTVLYCYMESSYALNSLTGTPAVGDVIVIGGAQYYKFTAGSVDTGTPAGTLLNPWLVAIGSTAQISLQNFANALNLQGNPGTDYSTATVTNPNVQPLSVGTNTMFVRSNFLGALGNSTTTTETGAAMAWATPTLSGGGAPAVFQVDVPGGVGAVSVGYIASYVVVIPVQGGLINGRFYWINPGETSINGLDFATAERAPDPVFNVVVFGDQFWLPGSTTTEVWYFTGNINAPVQRLQGVTFDRGTWSGTAVQVKESMIIVDSDGGVFQIAGGLQRISNPSIEERIADAILYQQSRTP